ncbi:MAG TPA: glucose 1-dehydrogenase [Spongiibacteraceae bacterium]|jgi:NAD(P)-dependent dehydrogenase (short-subunit alcohol dehydrogenase family)|nr:glucose 1-dehydrogenase [Spongiibacteraceae bacterium]HUH37616.1 glucose 1-dehydrogenase [Spongiibacteraceae bacterium]
MGARLKGKVAIVTGSTRGIGVAIAQHFAEEGAAVMVTGRSEQRGEDVCAGIRAAGGKANFFASDLADAASLKRLVEETVARFGGLTTLVNNGAVTALQLNDQPLATLSSATLNASIDSNIRGMVWLSQYALAAMQGQPGASIINVSSGLAIKGTPGMTAYTLAKGAMNAFTRGLARECGPQGIRINTLSPGVVLSNPETDRMLDDPATRDAMQKMNCLPHFGEPQDIANACLFLASDEARYITGALLCVDGGATC